MLRNVRKFLPRRRPHRTPHTAWPSLWFLHGGLKFFDRGATTFVIDRTFIGQRQSPRRAIEQPDPERGLEALHVLAHGRRRYAERGRRFGETARGNDLHEGGNAGWGFHDILNQRLTVI